MGLFNNSRKQEERTKLIKKAQKTVNYTLNNANKFDLVISKLIDETNNLISKINTFQNSRLTFKEKIEFKEKKKKVIDNLTHLYLAKEYLILVNRMNNELPLSDNQYIFIIKFVAFFDGSKVLGVELEDEEYDSPLFDTYEIHIEELTDNFAEKINKFIVPSFDDCAVLKNKKIEVFNCKNCNCLIDSKAKFCPECGSKIENIQKKYCSICKTELSDSAKFCPECGTKVS